MANLFDYPGWGTTVTIARNPPPTLSGGPEGWQGEITFLLNSCNELAPFILFCAGTVETIPISGGTLDRIVPLRHPDVDEMFIESFHADYLGTPMAEAWSSGLSIHTEQFNRVALRCLFKTLPHGVGSGQNFYTVDTETSASVEVIPGGAMKTATNRPLTGERGIVIPNVTIVVTTYLSPAPVSYAIQQMVGKVNSVNFTTSAGTYPPGTLRFDGIRDQRSFGTTGSAPTKSFAFKYREKPWNEVMNDLGVWEVAVAVSGGANKYQSADLNLVKSA